ncbi:MAG: Dabb family protein [Halobacteria archaeon]|nr:Dabb family protein [Halobacteria archaeon]
MNHAGRVLATLLLTTALLACAGPDKAPARTLEHVVVVWLKEPGNAAHRQMILNESEVLREIPGVLSLKSGSAITSERVIVDSSFDVALIVSFTNRSDMDAYLVHPLHVQLVNETLKPLVTKIRVFDFQ